MFEIGSSLRQARQHRGLEPADVERATNVRAKYLGALEDDRFDLLPAPAYVRGFLRTYAEFLGLDGSLLVDEYNEHFAPREDEEPQPIAPAGIGYARAHAFRPGLAVLPAVLAAATLAVWQLGFTSASPRRVETPTPSEPAAAAAPRAAAQTRASPATPTPATAPRTLVIRAARGPCWVAVRLGSAGGRLVFERTVAAGQTVRFGLSQALWVRLGAPWNADITLRGKRVGGFPHTPVNLTAS